MDPIIARMRRKAIVVDKYGYRYWTTCANWQPIKPSSMALLICDVWDDHWSRGAIDRINILAPEINEVAHAARDKGVQIIHAPSDVMPFYSLHKARLRIKNKPKIPGLVRVSNVLNPPLAVEIVRQGSDTGETKPRGVWSTQHPAIDIDQNVDVISDNGEEIFSYLKNKGIEYVFYVGVHVHDCILRRSFGIIQMKAWGMKPVLIKDLTDSLYNPEYRPYVSHEEGNRLIIEYIEKFHCYTIAKIDILK